jgi:hypothetical protein
VTRLARRLVKLIRGSKNLEYIRLEDCVSKELRAARRWVDHVVSVVLCNKEALDKKLYEELCETTVRFRIDHPEFEEWDFSYARSISSYPMESFWEALERYAQLAEAE